MASLGSSWYLDSQVAPIFFCKLMSQRSYKLLYHWIIDLLLTHKSEQVLSLKKVVIYFSTPNYEPELLAHLKKIYSLKVITVPCCVFSIVQGLEADHISWISAPYKWEGNWVQINPTALSTKYQSFWGKAAKSFKQWS